MRIFIASTTGNPARARKLVLLEAQGRWVYIGGDVREAKHWESALGESWRREDLGYLLQKTADGLQASFLSWIDDLGCPRRDSIGWWLAQISEKNTNISTLFLQICLLRATLTLLEENPGIWLLVVSSEAMGRTLCLAAGARSWPVTRVRSPWLLNLTRGIWSILKALFGRIEVLYKWIHWRSAVKHMPATRLSPGRVDVLLHTWLRDDCLSSDGQFVERYLGPLPDRLSESGYRIQYLVLPGSFVASMNSWSSLMRPLAESGQLFPAQRFAGWWDILRALFLVPWICRIPEVKQTFAGEDITPLIKSERREQQWSSRASNAYLYYIVMRRAGRDGCLPGHIIYMYENHIWEKGLCLGVRAGGTKARLIGYQHSYIPWGFLSYMPGVNERSSGCMPDRIVTSGDFWCDWFRALGHVDVRVGGALRTSALYSDTEKTATGTRPVVLVCPTSCILPTLELLWQVYRAFGSKTDVEIWLKPHPIAGLSEPGCRELFDGKWPAHFRFVNGPVASLLRNASVLLYTSTSIVYEALALGIPTVAWSTEFEIDRDPLRWQPQIRRSARCTAELRTQVLAALNPHAEGRAAWKLQAQEIAGKCLSPVSTNLIKIFTDP